ncbi:hypothetical protein TeGR_g7386, partial [Tetraparma gracilis]
MSAPAFPDPRADASAYLKEKKVLELFSDLGSKAVYAKPDDLNLFMANALRDLQDGNKSDFFSDKDVETM